MQRQAQATSLSMPRSVGRVKHQRAMPGALEGNNFVGQKAQSLRGLLRIKYPMEHGIVTDWNDMELIYNHVYSELNTHSEEVSRRQSSGERGDTLQHRAAVSGKSAARKPRPCSRECRMESWN